MLEVNCDDSSDVMKRLKEHRAVIIRDNRHDRERRREGEQRWRESVAGQEKVQQNKKEEQGRKKKRQRESFPLSSDREKNTSLPSTSHK